MCHRDGHSGGKVRGCPCVRELRQPGGGRPEAQAMQPVQGRRGRPVLQRGVSARTVGDAQACVQQSDRRRRGRQGGQGGQRGRCLRARRSRGTERAQWDCCESAPQRPSWCAVRWRGRGDLGSVHEPRSMWDSRRRRWGATTPRTLGRGVAREMHGDRAVRRNSPIPRASPAVRQPLRGVEVRHLRVHASSVPGRRTTRRRVHEWCGWAEPWRLARKGAQWTQKFTPQIR